MRFKKAALILAPIVIVVPVVFFSLRDPDGWQQFAFLQGQNPITDQTRDYGWAMKGVVNMSRGAASSDGPPSKARQLEYTFKADYSRLVADANGEILKRGGWEVDGIDDRRWKLPDNLSVFISPVRFDPLSGAELPEKGWVRVTIHRHWVVSRLNRILTNLWSEG